MTKGMNARRLRDAVVESLRDAASSVSPALRFPVCPIFRERGHRLHVLVAAPGEVDEDYLLGAHLARQKQGVGDGVGRFERGDDAFEAGEEAEGFERLGVGGRDVLDAGGVAQVRVLGAD